VVCLLVSVLVFDLYSLDKQEYHTGENMKLNVDIECPGNFKPNLSYIQLQVCCSKETVTKTFYYNFVTNSLWAFIGCFPHPHLPPRMEDRGQIIEAFDWSTQVYAMGIGKETLAFVPPTWMYQAA